MPSSTSSSERPGLVLRQTAADRPGVAQPVPERELPPRPWAAMAAFALVLAVVLGTGWEIYWRQWGALPGYRNDDSQWAAQRRRINSGEGHKAVLIGSSRTLFDIQLDVWEKATGERPIQLALEGNSAVQTLEDLAADPDFTGRLLVGVAPDLFFTGYTYRGSAAPYYHHEGPAQRAGHWLSQRLIEPYFAFYDSDFALAAVLMRQHWPLREGKSEELDVRKLLVCEADRNCQMWDKLEYDSAYRNLARRIWAGDFDGAPGMETPEKGAALIEKQIARAVTAVAMLKQRGVRIVFVRAPSIDDYYAYEQRFFPRAATWDVLLARTGVPGIHFEDHPALQTRELPEWSHMTAGAARRYTQALAPMVQAQWRAR